MKFLKNLLSDNRGDTHLERIIIIAIAFVGGALLIAAIIAAIKGGFPSGIDWNIHEYLGE